MKVEVDPFVAMLERLRKNDDRAALAKLRRGLGKKMGTPEMFPYVVPFLPKSRQGEEHYFLVASLFALHSDPADRGRSMGAVFRGIMGESGSESIEKRFVQLLSADVEDIGGRLRHAVSLAKYKRVGICYHRLLGDLRRWNHRDRFVQLGWAKDFWGRTEMGVSETKKGE